MTTAVREQSNQPPALSARHPAVRAAAARAGLSPDVYATLRETERQRPAPGAAAASDVTTAPAAAPASRDTIGPGVATGSPSR